MRNITIHGKNLPEAMEEKAFKLLHEGKYKEAYESLLHLKSKDRHLDKVNFALGFICELEAVEGTSLGLAELYYSEAAEFGNIEAKVRIAMLAEKGKILDINEAYNLYNEVVEQYQSYSDKLPESEAKSLASNAAFAYYRLGKMYEKSIFVSENSPKDNKLKAQELYDLSLGLYNQYQLNNLDKARVLNRIGWIRYEVFLEQNNWNNTLKVQQEIEVVEKIFNESSAFGNKEAKLGLLNIQAFKHALINDSLEDNIIQAKSCIKEALNIDSNHLPTLLLAVRIETSAPTTKDHKIALEYIRKAMELAPSDEGVKKKFDEIIGFQSRNFAITLNNCLKDDIEEIIRNASKRGASQETINKSQKLQEIFYPQGYSSAYWVTKQTYSQESLDKHFKESITYFMLLLTPVISQNKFFRELYNPVDQENLAKQVVKDLLESDTDLNLIKLIVKTGQVHQLEKAHLDQKIANQFDLFYNNKNKGKKENLLFTREEHQWVSSQEEFIKLFCNKFIDERNAIESIVKGKALPLEDKVDKLKYGSNKIGLLLNAPPFSYLGNALGIYSWTIVLASFTTDYAHSIYKESVISSFVAVNKLLPRREEANEVILNIAKEFASKYSAQIANIKDHESLKKFTEVTIERMMSHVIAQTSIVKQIQDSVNNKINSDLNFVLRNDEEPKPVNSRKLLYEGIWYGKSGSRDQRIRTYAEEREYKDHWLADGILEKTGIITDDKRIFGNIKTIEKYGCVAGDDRDIAIRRLQPINQAQLSLEFKSKLNEAYGKQQEMHSIIEQISYSYKKSDNIKMPTTPKNYNTVFAKAIIGIGAAFLLLSLAVMYIPLLALASTIVPGLITAGSLLTITGIVFGRNTKNYTASHVNINETKVDHTDIANQEKEAIKVRIDKIKGPTPLDNYNTYQENGNTKQELKSHKIRSDNISSAEKQRKFTNSLTSKTLGGASKG